MAQYNDLLDALDSGSCRFRELTQDEVVAMDDVYKAKVATGKLPSVKPHKIHSDAEKPQRKWVR